ncbi:putative membrane protein [Wickerhamomyces ciferrii]|uniref:Membrane protein n=1 Tax=Wickerhamomyces ciferrii (strain ATCC 14091 / BCRC 22168 / CBS 111 / JCM 3599 / NBRC 0793 / NRRL Y-1031 F-60-10) TaxID=1206466 RepID=K0KCT3_WICCF|nr:uncharacterized protein BN7_235 [Wickerhamomyces ciferrii]CCH40701.1 putative membrane protein [Wickerhamomyces ciferrii]
MSSRSISNDSKKIDTSSDKDQDITTGEVITSFISPLNNTKDIEKNADEALTLALANQDRHIELDPKATKRLIRKVDFCILPMIGILYACQFMDKITHSYAAVMGLKIDLGMKGDMYAWTATIFWLGYLIFEFPASYMLQKFPLSKMTSIFIFIWGVILCLHAVPNYAGFLTLRFLLGVFESSISPAMVILTSQWYPKELHFQRTCFWFACNGIGIMMGGAIAYGCAINAESYPFEAWKLLFIVTGLMTIVLSFLFALHIPDTPAKAWFLSSDEKLLIVEIIRNNQQGFGNKHFKKYQFIETMKDPLTWMYFWFALISNIPNGSLTNFGSILLSEDFGYDAKSSLLMNMPCGAVEFVGCISISMLAYKIKRTFVSMFAMVLALLASCLLAFPENNNNARLAGYYLEYIFPLSMMCALSLIASNTAGHTKKITTTAIYFIGLCTGNLIGPQTFTGAPYTGGKIVIVACNVITLIIIIMTYFYYKYLNKKKQENLAKMSEEELKAFENTEFADLTDRENPNFKYSL